MQLNQFFESFSYNSSRFIKMFESLIVGVFFVSFGFFVPYLMYPNLPLAIISGAFWLNLFIGYLVTNGKNELRAEKFYLFSFLLSMVMILVGFSELLAINEHALQTHLSLALSWPLCTMGLILFVLSAAGEVAILTKNSSYFKGWKFELEM